MTARCGWRPRSRSHDPAAEKGAAAVEFALVLPILLMLVFGIIQYGIYFFSMQSGSSAVREAARRIAVGDCNDPDQLKLFVEARLSGTPASDVQPSVSYDPARQAGAEATVRIEFDALNFHFPFIPVPNDGAVVKEVQTRIEDTESSGSCT